MYRFIAVTLLTAGCVQAQTETEFFSEGEDFDRVELRVERGSIAVWGDPRGEASGEARSTFTGKPPEIRHYVDGGVFYVEGSCPKLKPTCRVDVDLTVPEDVAVFIDTQSGDVFAQGSLASLSASTNSGDVVGDELASPSVDVRAEAGELDVDLVDDVESVSLETGSGDVVLSVPAGSYSIHTESTSGDVDLDRVDLIDDPSSPRLITARTGRGDVRIEGN